MSPSSSSKQALHSVARPSQELLQRWIQKHADLLAKERQVEQQESRLLLSKCSPKQLERNGLAILGLGILEVSVGLGGKTLVQLERPAAYHTSPTFPPHSLRPGDIVQIERQSGNADQSSTKGKNADKDKESPLPGIVFNVSDSKIVIAATGNSSKDDTSSTDLTELTGRVHVVKVANDATFDRMEWTLTRLARLLNVSVKTAKRSYDASSSDEEEQEEAKELNGVEKQLSELSTAPSTLIAALMGQSVPTWHSSSEQVENDLALFNENLNDSQIAAVKFALNAEHFSLIHGPPGTGKTTAVAEMVLQLAVHQQKRVLVCGASNLAADNLLERIVTKGADALKKSHVGITRIGHPARVLPSIVTSTLDYQAQHSSEGALVKDVKAELEQALSSLRPRQSTAAGNKSSSWRGQASAKSQRVRGNERKERREEIKALRKEFRKRSQGLVRSVLQRASIVVSTCHGAGGKQLNGMDFDVVVVDEACQATEATCWTPILKAKLNGTLILAGDHLQLPPTVKSYRHSQHHKRIKMQDNNSTATDATDDNGESNESEVQEQYEPVHRARRTTLRPPRSLETTLFSRLLGMYGQGCKALLDTQYRMNDDIMAFPNETLYQGQIKADESCAMIRLKDLEGYNVEDDVEEDEATENAPIVFYDTAGCDLYETQQTSTDDEDQAGATGKTNILHLDSRANVHEVELVAQHVKMLLKNGLSPERISVLSPYNLQVSALADRLRGGGTVSTEKSLGMERIVVASIDSMQGMENDVVIISLVRSNDQRSVGFLAEHRRLNVAMTRAKRQLCIVGDSETIAHAGDEYLKQWMDFLEQRALIEPVIV